ncbi:MAG: hypothetical protein LBU30_05150 [Candidatus Methanoplasma sp.]|nr:hypothetical protein [Candidatus Methanoplasma sp.]
MPRNSLAIMASVLAATSLFILLCAFIESVKTPIWMFIATSVIFAAIMIFCLSAKIRISIEDEVLHIRFLRLHMIPLENIIDYKIGDLSIMRNYSGWGISKVTFKNIIAIGYERGISMKVSGRRVFTISLSDPEGFAGLLPPGECPS